MMKSFIVASISITYLLTIANLAHAKDSAIAHDLVAQNQSILIAKKLATSRDRIVSESDLKSIRQAIVAHYREYNEKQGTEQHGVERFYEVKEINIIDFEVRTLPSGIISKSAAIEALQNDHVYDRGRLEGKSFRRFNTQRYSRMIIEMSFNSETKKWNITHTGFNASFKKRQAVNY